MKIQHVLIACAGAALMAGCEDNYASGYGPDYYDPGYYGPYANDSDYYYGPTADLEFDAYYDGYYGPIYDGYWRSGAFYYRTAPTSGFRQGETAHFRSSPAEGFNHVHGVAHARTAPAQRPTGRPPG